MLKTALFSVLALLAPHARAATACATPSNLVQNCGFETGNFSGWKVFGDAARAGVDHVDAHSGSFGAFLAGLGSFNSGQANFTFLSQELTTQPGVTYQLSYSTAHFTNAAVKPDNVFAASIGGVNIPTSQQENIAQADFAEAGPFPFVAKAPTTTLSFMAEDANFYFSLDDVAVTTTPEPAGWLLVIIAVGVMCVVRLRAAEIEPRV